MLIEMDLAKIDSLTICIAVHMSHLGTQKKFKQYSQLHFFSFLKHYQHFFGQQETYDAIL